MELLPDSSERTRAHILPRSLPPIGLSRLEAAAYIAISPSKFDELVRDGLMPKPKKIGARRVWDRTKLERFFAALPGDDGDAEMDEWGAFNQ